MMFYKKTIARMESRIAEMEHRIEALEKKNAEAVKELAILRNKNAFPDAPTPFLKSLAETLEKRGETPYTVAKKTGMTSPNIRDIISGWHNITPKIADRFAAAFGFDKDALVNQDGPLCPRKLTPAQEKRITRHYLSKYAD